MFDFETPGNYYDDADATRPRISHPDNGAQLAAICYWAPDDAITDGKIYEFVQAYAEDLCRLGSL